ncbi:MAG: glycosyltransferase family 2 protein [Flavobacteriales bacterium]|nr:glycosyltransferase family 2 protein [Flavobacteriales bacterium]
MVVDVIIPAFNEEASVALVIQDLPDLVREIIVVDNNSIDATAARAKEAGATVIEQRLQGYGNACLKGIAYVSLKNNPPDIVVFLDADYSDNPIELLDLIKPIHYENADLVIGSRSLGQRERGSMLPQQRFGNWLATVLVKIVYGKKISDLGPFRAVDFKKLLELDMQDKTYGWTIEMQLKAIKQNYNYREVPVSYRKRIGVSKITGTVKGTILAGVKIIGTIIKLR